MERDCRWVWDGDAWGEHPLYPHDCPPGKTCPTPTQPGTEIGQEVSTACQ